MEDMSQSWRKSSYSGNDGGNCVEVSNRWRKSSFSGNGGGNCVEVATESCDIAVRDSKDPHGSVLTLPAAWWHWFIAAIKAGPHGD